MKFFPALWLETPGQGTSISRAGACRQLASFMTAGRKSDAFLEEYVSQGFVLARSFEGVPPEPRRIELLLDSGAFSGWTKGHRVNFPAYIRYCQRNTRAIGQVTSTSEQVESTELAFAASPENLG